MLKVEKQQESSYVMDEFLSLSRLTTAALNSHPDSVLIIDERKHTLFCNQAILRLLNTNEEHVLGSKIDEVFARFDANANEKFISFIDAFFRGRQDDLLAKEYLLESESGWRGVLEVRLEPIAEENPLQGEIKLALIVLRDVTSQWNMKNELRYQATHDSLTGLLNRREFENRMNDFIQHGSRTGVKHSFCFIDLNKFKKINDHYGHIAGDSLLKELSRHFLAQLRKGDVLGRLGGDEFGLILGSCSGENAMRILKELQANLAKRQFTYNDESFYITASIGLIDFGPETPSVKDMLHVADFACYKAKRNDQGTGSVVYIPGNI